MKIILSLTFAISIWEDYWRYYNYVKKTSFPRQTNCNCNCHPFLPVYKLQAKMIFSLSCFFLGVFCLEVLGRRGHPDGLRRPNRQWGPRRALFAELSCRWKLVEIPSWVPGLCSDCFCFCVVFIRDSVSIPISELRLFLVSICTLSRSFPIGRKNTEEWFYGLTTCALWGDRPQRSHLSPFLHWLRISLGYWQSSV